MIVTKAFKVEGINGTFPTLKAAKATKKCPRISRVWLDENGNELAEHLVSAWDELVCKVKDADEHIKNTLNL